jgi:2,3-bisphosphoglycerate-independent phosphoglycerate mutase
MQTYVLGILDGWGIAKPSPHNAITLAKTPFYSKILNNHPNCLLNASETSVGLPEGTMGNSEVGHLTIGCGRINYQSLARINHAIDNGELAIKLKNIKQHHLITPGSTCHLITMISDGGVHSHINHLLATNEILKDIPLKLHAITDGRDTAPRSCLNYLKLLEQAKINIATICGRFYAMDRDQRYERTEVAVDAILNNNGERFENAADHIAKLYSNNDQTDEFIMPAISNHYNGIKPNDTIIILNFRADRIRQLLRAINQFKPKNTIVCGISDYGDEFSDTIVTLFPQIPINNTLGEVISQHNWQQLRLAESEKYAHITYFFNGGIEQPFPGEERVLVPSPKVTTYDLTPSMSIYELTEEIIKAIEAAKYNFICFNFANADMVGHTGNLPATVLAVEAIDQCLGGIYRSVLNKGCHMIITSDHGNAEQLYDDHEKQAHTAHTLNPVPMIYIGSNNWQLNNGALFDVAPTLLDLMQLPKPSSMSGYSLFTK